MANKPKPPSAPPPRPPPPPYPPPPPQTAPPTSGLSPEHDYERLNPSAGGPPGQQQERANPRTTPDDGGAGIPGSQNEDAIGRSPRGPRGAST